ncbi:MAG: SDR family NAD(P)-dependent oxidoreductase [Chitinophagales bacterium]
MSNTARKTVLVTGANGNLGSAVTKTFLDKDYLVVATVVEEAMVKDLADHEHLQVNVVNLANEKDSENFVHTVISRYGKVEGALLLVGGFAMGSIKETSGADLKKQFELNFETAYYTTRLLFQHMMDNNSGRIIFIGSRPALVPSQGKNVLAYALSKSLLFRLSECLNEEARGKNVSATVIVPSTLDTPQNRKSMPNADPSNWVKPADLAEILEFVVNEKSAPLREAVLKVYNNS